MSERYFIIRASPYKFTAVVFFQKEGGLYRIRFGGKQACVFIEVYEEELYPNLTSLGTNKECALEPGAGLLPGAGTVRMVKAAIRFVYTLFPHQKDIYFKDTSKVSCSRGRVSLAHLYIAKYHQTWYQQKLGAVLVNDSDENSLKDLVKCLRQPYRETFDIFYTTFIIPNMRPHNKELVYQKLEPLHKAHRTYHGWLKDVASHYDCSILRNWLEAFFRTLSPFDFRSEWKIKKDIAMTWSEIDITPTTTKPLFSTFIQSGGWNKIEDWDGIRRNNI